MKKIGEENTHIINPHLSLHKYSHFSYSLILASYRKDEELEPYLYATNFLYLLKYDNKYAGYYYLIELPQMIKWQDRLILSAGLTKPYRSDFKEHKKGIGTYVLTSISDYIFENYDYQKIGLDIKWDNIASIKSATNAGYEIDYDLLQTYEEEDYRYTPYVRIRQ